MIRSKRRINTRMILFTIIAICNQKNLFGYTFTVMNGTSDTISFTARTASCKDLHIPKLERFETKSLDTGKWGTIPCCINISNSFAVNNQKIIHDKSMHGFSPCSSLSVIIRDGTNKQKGRFIIAKHDDPIKPNSKQSAAQIAQAKEEVRKNIGTVQIDLDEFYKRVRLHLSNPNGVSKFSSEEKKQLQTTEEYKKAQKNIIEQAEDIKFFTSHLIPENPHASALKEKIDALIAYRTALYLYNPKEYEDAVVNFQQENKPTTPSDMATAKQIVLNNIGRTAENTTLIDLLAKLYLLHADSFYALMENEKNIIRESKEYQKAKKEVMQAADIQFFMSNVTQDNPKAAELKNKINELIDSRTLVYLRDKKEYNTLVSSPQVSTTIPTADQIAHAKELVQQNYWNRMPIPKNELQNRVKLYLMHRYSFYIFAEKEKLKARTTKQYAKVQTEIVKEEPDIKFLIENTERQKDEVKKMINEKLSEIIDQRTLLYLNNPKSYKNSIQQFAIREKIQQARDFWNKNVERSRVPAAFILLCIVSDNENPMDFIPLLQKKATPSTPRKSDQEDDQNPDDLEDEQTVTQQPLVD